MARTDGGMRADLGDREHAVAPSQVLRIVTCDVVLEHVPEQRERGGAAFRNADRQ
jgi:hypothetical protein